jgi:hypothetical protein
MIFEIRNGRAFPTPFALRMQHYGKMWEEDTSDENEECIKKFTYIEFMLSPRKDNPFHGYEEDKRVPRVKKEVWNDENHPIDTDIILGMEVYKEYLRNASPTFPLYEAALVAADNLKKSLKSMNLDERTNSGTAVLKPKDVTNALKDVPDVIKSLQTMRNSVHAELVEDNKTRGDRTIGMYER